MSHALKHILTRRDLLLQHETTTNIIQETAEPLPSRQVSLLQQEQTRADAAELIGLTLNDDLEAIKLKKEAGLPPDHIGCCAWNEKNGDWCSRPKTRGEYCGLYRRDQDEIALSKEFNTEEEKDSIDIMMKELTIMHFPFMAIEHTIEDGKIKIKYTTKSSEEIETNLNAILNRA
jgi:hypothetical protein